MKAKIKKILKGIGMIIFFILMVYFLDVWGIIGILIFILGMFGLRCWKQRAFLTNIMRQIEMTVFGKPLDKDMWDKGEMGNTKIEIVWGKNKFDWNKYIIILIYPGLLLFAIGVMWDIKSITIMSLVLFSTFIIIKSIYLIRRLIKHETNKS